jgi:hypothetical protein
MWAGAGTMPRGLSLRIGTGLALAGLAALMVTAIWLSDHEPDPPHATAVPDVVQVGVVDGQSVPGYLRASDGELAALTHASAPNTQVWALVSLDAYLPPGRLTAVLGGVAVAQVYARAPMAGALTQVVRIPVYRVPDDVVAGMLSAAAGRDRERADYQQLSDEVVGGDAQQARLRRAYQSAARTAADEANAYRARCSCVFAAVVRAAPAGLEDIARHAEVRTVDPAPEVRRLDRTEFRPPLPEQHTTVPEDPRIATTPTPPAASPVAPGMSAPLPSSTGANVSAPASGGPSPGSVPSAPASEERASAPAQSGPAQTQPAQSQDQAVPTATAGASGR